MDKERSKKIRNTIIVLLIIIVIILLLLRSCDEFGKGNGKGSDGKNAKETVQEVDKKTADDKGGGDTPSPQPQPQPEKKVVYPKGATNLVYTGSQQKLVVAGSGTDSSNYFEYSLDDSQGSYSKAVPQEKDADTYTVYWRYIKNGKVVKTGTLEVTIAKANDVVTIKPAENLVANDEAQDLVVSASSKYGLEIEYSVNSGLYSTDIPYATDAGEYLVRWRTTGTDNVIGTSGMFKVVISDKPIPTASIEYNTGLSYNAKAQQLVKSASVTLDAVLEFSLDEETWTEDITEITAKNAGTHTVYYRVVETKAYAGITGSKEIEIDTVDDVATITPASGLKENDTAQDLIESGSSIWGSLIEYSLDGVNYSTDIPQKVKAGEYTVYWRTEANSNLIADSGNVQVTIAAKDNPTVTLVLNDELTYTGKEQQLISSAEAPEGTTLEFSLDNVVWTSDASSITVTDAGDYVVYYRVKETSQYAELTGQKGTKIAKAPLSSIVLNETESLPFTFDGEEHSVSISKVTAGVGGNLVDVDEKEYTASGTFEASAKGSYNVKVVAKASSSNYTGSAELNWSIGSEGIGIGSLKIQGEGQQGYSVNGASYSFTGSEIKPSYQVIADGNTLVEGVDYEVVTGSTTAATNKGDYTIKVQGIGEYAGETNVATATWKITAVQLGNATVDKNELEYTGKKLVPTITVKNAAGTVTLEEGVDYTVTFTDSTEAEVTDPTDVGSYTATITGIGNYTGTTTTSWKIKENYVCQIVGGAKYTSLQSAINAATSGQTIVMLKDVSDSAGVVVPGDKNITINLGGKTYLFDKAVTGNEGAETAGMYIYSGATVALTNGTIGCTEANKTSIWKSGDTNKGVTTVIRNCGELTTSQLKLDGTNVSLNGTNARANGTIEATGGNITMNSGTVVNGQLRVGTDANVGTATTGSTVTINSGATINKPVSTAQTVESAILVYGDNTLNVDGTVNGRIATDKATVNGGSTINVKSKAAITEDNDVGIFLGSGTLNILGGTVQGKTAVYVKGKSFSITGGTLIGNGEAQDYLYWESGYVATGQALVIDNCNAPAGLDGPLVTGGYFRSVNSTAVGSYADNGQKSAMKEFIYGGYFSDTKEVMNASGLVNPEYEADATVDEVYKSVIDEKEIKYYTVTTGSFGYEDEETLVENKIVDTPTMSPADGVVEAGQSVTLTADRSSTYGSGDGWVLDGWSIKNSDNTFTLISSDTTGTLTYTPVGDVTVYARYKPFEKATYTLTVIAEHFTVDIGDTHYDQTVTADYDEKDGTEITVKYAEDTGKTFLAWKNQSNVIVSMESEYTFALGSKTTLQAVTSDPTASDKLLIYSTDTQVLQSTMVTESTISDLKLPEAPPKSGYKHVGWSVMDGTTELGVATNDAGLRLIVTNNFATAGSFKVVAKYEIIPEYCTVTIVYPDGSTTPTEVLKGTIAYVTATKTIEGKSFDYWSSDEEGTVKLSYDTIYAVLANTDKTVYAIYSTTPEVKKPTVNIEVVNTTSGTYYVIKVTVSWSAPDGYEMIEQGFLRSSIATTTGDDLTLANADNAETAAALGIKKSVMTDPAKTGSNILNIAVSDLDKMFRIKGYIIYKKTGELQTETKYTDLIYTSWNSAASK